MPLRTLTKAILIAGPVALLGCGQPRRAGDLLSLERALVHDFHTDAISVDEQHGAIPPAAPATVLIVSFTSSDAVTLAGPDRAGFSRQVADYVRDHYAGYAGLDRISVRFARVPRAGAPVPGDSGESYSFTPTQLVAPPQPPGTPRP